MLAFRTFFPSSSEPFGLIDVNDAMNDKTIAALLTVYSGEAI
jgi:uncharacterized protein YjgD (DUF1641 family)